MQKLINKIHFLDSTLAAVFCIIALALLVTYDHLRLSHMSPLLNGWVCQ